jgi:hypothetical protein
VPAGSTVATATFSMRITGTTPRWPGARRRGSPCLR